MNESSIRILLVDDNPDDRALVRREAEALFPDSTVHEVGEREDFEKVLTAGADYGLVVTDLQLKWGNGREVITSVRATCSAAAIVMFTGTGDEMTAVELMKSGLDDYVVKHARQLPRLRASMKLAVENARQRSALGERERQLTAALAHKDVIVRELHHRVKNNLQAVITLLDMKARTSGGALAAELLDLSGRMRALAKVQARIYEAEGLDRVNFAMVLREMATELVKIYGDKQILLTLDLPDSFELEVGEAMPLALLCYEILLNAMKHAWPAGRGGKLVVQLVKRDGGCRLNIRDDGAGFDEAGVIKGFGSRLNPALAREANVQLAISSRAGQGTNVGIAFR